MPPKKTKKAARRRARKPAKNQRRQAGSAAMPKERVKVTPRLPPGIGAGEKRAPKQAARASETYIERDTVILGTYYDNFTIDRLASETPLNPRCIGSRLNEKSRYFSRAKFRKATVKWTPGVNLVSGSGQVMIAYESDVGNPSPQFVIGSSIQEVLGSYAHHATCPVQNSMEWTLHGLSGWSADPFWINQLDDDTSGRRSHQGKILFALVGVPASGALLGSLSLTYEIEFYGSRVPTTLPAGEGTSALVSQMTVDTEQFFPLEMDLNYNQTDPLYNDRSEDMRLVERDFSFVNVIGRSTQAIPVPPGESMTYTCMVHAQSRASNGGLVRLKCVFVDGDGLSSFVPVCRPRSSPVIGVDTIQTVAPPTGTQGGAAVISVVGTFCVVNRTAATGYLVPIAYSIAYDNAVGLPGTIGAFIWGMAITILRGIAKTILANTPGGIHLHEECGEVVRRVPPADTSTLAQDKADLVSLKLWAARRVSRHRPSFDIIKEPETASSTVASVVTFPDMDRSSVRK